MKLELPLGVRLWLLTAQYQTNLSIKAGYMSQTDEKLYLKWIVKTLCMSYRSDSVTAHGAEQNNHGPARMQHFTWKSELRICDKGWKPLQHQRNTTSLQKRSSPVRHLRAFDTWEDDEGLKLKVWLKNNSTSHHLSAAICAHSQSQSTNVPVCCCPQVSMCVCVSAMCMTTAIIILGRWSDLTPTNYVWPASQDRVPSVWCCPTPHWLVNEGLHGGVRVG